MARVRSEHGRESAKDSLSTVYPVPDDVEFRLRELAIDNAQEAERPKAGDSKGWGQRSSGKIRRIDLGRA